jgi:hypothetical protein
MYHMIDSRWFEGIVFQIEGDVKGDHDQAAHFFSSFIL